MKSEEPNLNQESLRPSESESAPSEKGLAWKQALADVDKLKDGLDKGVDEGIQESVAAFSVHGLTTSQSCEGHIAEVGEKQHGLPYPWIAVQVPAPKGYRDAPKEVRKQLEEVAAVENLEQQRKVIELLEEFYTGRETPFDARLTVEGDTRFGNFRVQSLGAHLTAILTPEERKQKLELYRKEMRDFTAFLKHRHSQPTENSA